MQQPNMKIQIRHPAYQLVGIEFYRDRGTVCDDERVRTARSVEFINSGGRRSVAGGRIGGNLAG